MAYTVEYLFSGSAVTTTLASDITDSSTALTLTSATGWASPSGSQRTPFTIAPGTAAEEHCYYTARSGTNLTTIVRAQDGTSAAAHGAGVTIVHGWHATGANEANYAVRKTVGAVTTQGDIIVADAANSFARLPIGTARQNLQVNSGATALAYAASLQSLMTTTGDIVYASAANTPARLAAGTSGYVLTSGGAGVAPSWVVLPSGLTRASNYVATAEGTTSSSFVAPSTAQTITATTGTTVWVGISCQMKVSSAGFDGHISFAISGATTTAAGDPNDVKWVPGTGVADTFDTHTGLFPVTVTAGSNTFAIQIKSDGTRTTTVQLRQFFILY